MIDDDGDFIRTNIGTYTLYRTFTEMHPKIEFFNVNSMIVALISDGILVKNNGLYEMVKQ